jgi:hypothetical protein
MVTISTALRKAGDLPPGAVLRYGGRVFQLRASTVAETWEYVSYIRHRLYVEALRLPANCMAPAITDERVDRLVRATLGTPQGLGFALYVQNRSTMPRLTLGECIDAVSAYEAGRIDAERGTV